MTDRNSKIQQKIHKKMFFWKKFFFLFQTGFGRDVMTFIHYASFFLVSSVKEDKYRHQAQKSEFRQSMIGFKQHF